jgi:hypothetical protein
MGFQVSLVLRTRLTFEQDRQRTYFSKTNLVTEGHVKQCAEYATLDMHVNT